MNSSDRHDWLESRFRDCPKLEREHLFGRVNDHEADAEEVLTEAGITVDDTRAAMDAVDARTDEDACLAYAAYLRLRAQALREHAVRGDQLAACRAAMDVEMYWQRMNILRHVDAYQRREPRDYRKGLPPEQVYLRDMDAGAKRINQVRNFNPEQDVRDKEWQRWRECADAIRANARRPLSAREVAGRVKAELCLDESTETIRKRIKIPG